MGPLVNPFDPSTLRSAGPGVRVRRTSVPRRSGQVPFFKRADPSSEESKRRNRLAKHMNPSNSVGELVGRIGVLWTHPSSTLHGPTVLLPGLRLETSTEDRKKWAYWFYTVGRSPNSSRHVYMLYVQNLYTNFYRFRGSRYIYVQSIL